MYTVIYVWPVSRFVRAARLDDGSVRRVNSHGGPLVTTTPRKPRVGRHEFEGWAPSTVTRIGPKTYLTVYDG